MPNVQEINSSIGIEPRTCLQHRMRSPRSTCSSAVQSGLCGCGTVWYEIYQCNGHLVRLLEFYVLATSKVISGWVLTCDSVHSWWLYSDSPLGDQATHTMAQFPSPLLYSDTAPTSLCPILIMPSAWLGSDMYQFLSHCFVLTMVLTHTVRIFLISQNCKMYAQLIWPSCLATISK